MPKPTYPPAALDTRLNHRARFASMALPWFVTGSFANGVTFKLWLYAIGIEHVLMIADARLRSQGHTAFHFTGFLECTEDVVMNGARGFSSQHAGLQPASHSGIE